MDQIIQFTPSGFVIDFETIQFATVMHYFYGNPELILSSFVDTIHSAGFSLEESQKEADRLYLQARNTLDKIIDRYRQMPIPSSSSVHHTMREIQ
ncbi:hypothetical protein [Mixta calida]|uniref:hypothetical protein n=1 Tax=Mixta calida TaxID=665913 RepID=UPI00290A29C9|nr:hypothetical protein [Mixta calida]MDU4290353.1 hypothetical protein [Mixta calida]